MHCVIYSVSIKTNPSPTLESGLISSRMRKKRLVNVKCEIRMRQVERQRVEREIERQTERDWLMFSSVQFSHSLVSDSLRPHESQHSRPPYPSPTHGIYSNSCPSRRRCHPAISSSVVPFSSCPQSLPVSGSFPMSQLFIWSGQSIGVSASASVLPMNT